jgi:hypothetical protein
MSMHYEVKQAVENAMTVGQLREILDGLEDSVPVMFACDYGDYHHTTQALPLESGEIMSQGQLRSSAYSHSKVSLAKYDEDDENGAYCDTCDEMYEEGGKNCPVCGKRMVDEDGEPWDRENGGEDVLILK